MIDEYTIEIKIAGNDAHEITPEKLDDYVGVLGEEFVDVVGVAVSFTSDAFTTSMTVEAEGLEEAAVAVYNRVPVVAEKVGLPMGPIIRWFAMSAEEADAELSSPTYPPVLGIAELANMLGISRQRASQVARTQNFPRPYADLASGPVWFEPNVKHFVENWERKPGRPRKVDV